MPTYEYRCRKCNHEFEEFQSITAKPLRKCPKCRGKVQRLISAGNGFIFKGSGFYITDYKKSSERSEKKSDKKPENKSEKKIEGKKENKAKSSSESS